MSAIWGRVRHAVSGRRAPAVALMVASLALVVAPVPGSGCPSVMVASAAQPHAEPPRGDAPEEGSDLVAAKVRLNAAEEAVAALDEVDAAAAHKDATAREAEEKATDAEDAADSSYPEDSTSTVDGAQSEVDIAQSAVDMYESELQAEQDTLDSDQAEGLDTSYDEESVKQTAASLTDAKNDLATKKAALKSATSDAATAAAASKARADAAKALRVKAEKARSAADAAQQDAADQRTAAEAERDQAARRETDLQAGYQRSVNAWTHARTQAVAEVRALNAEAADCQATATRNGAVAATLAGTGLLLLLPYARIRPPRRPRWLTRRSGSR